MREDNQFNQYGRRKWQDEQFKHYEKKIMLLHNLESQTEKHEAQLKEKDAEIARFAASVE
ncbi:hypothetical protein [Candidatus Gromoviella agglomerans]|uniref:hypothetical protein n=1 Tax=Candidatus Gromoviella agglomerans TaxID=2806609 RepID=UPI001E4B29B7|nr:hypothetical protein [Candidatus Gromoviella agglomerans]